jgi:hypothetical protein
MAIFSYSSGSTLPKILEYADQQISQYSNEVVSVFGLRNQNLFRISSSSEQLFERFSYTYNEFSDRSLEVFDFGGLLDEVTEVENFGSITSTATEFEVYGSITQTSTFATGTIGKIISSTKYSITRADEIQGVTFLFQGKSNVYINKSHIGYGIVSDINGILVENNTESYVGTGRAFGFGSKAERVVSSYNNSSVVSFESIDYNLILSPEDSSEDYGSILDEPNLTSERDDYGFVTGRGLRPYGLTKLISTTIEKNTEDYVGTGSLFAFDTVKVFVLPIHIGRGTLKIRGEYSNLKNTESYVGTGSLFTFSSTTEAFSPKPSISGLFNINGIAIEKNTENYVGTGVAFGIGNTLESITEPYIGSGNINVLGGYSNLKNTESYVGTGRAFGFGSKAESTVVSYNESSTVDFESIDYNLILSPEDSSEDYGSILDEPNLTSERDDYGFVTGRGLRPYGLSKFSGHLVEKNTENYVGSGELFGFGNVKVFVLPKHIGSGSISITGAVSDLRNTESYVGTGSLFTFSSTTEAVGSKPPVSGLFKFSGHLIEKNTENYVGTGILFEFGQIEVASVSPYVGSGSISISGAYSNLKNTESYVGTGRAFGFGSKAESTSVSYNESSVVEFEGIDYGLINDVENSIEDYGSIIDEPNLTSERDDYGLITGRGLRPYGLSRFSGHLVEKNAESYVGSGILFEFGQLQIASASPYVGSGTIKIKGAVSDLKNTESYVGTGSLFTFSSKTEAVGSKPPSSGLFKFFGHLIEKNTEHYTGTGILFEFGQIEVASVSPYVGSGSIKIKGSASDLRNTESYVGTGRAFGFGSKAESTSVSYNESSVVDYDGLDYGYVGSLEESTEDYGSILDEPNLTSERDDYGFIIGRGLRPYGLSRFSGTAEPIIITLSYVGTGSLFTFSSTTEAFGPKPPSSGLFRISGAATQSITPTTEIGSGSLFTFSSTTEAVGSKPPVSGLFKFSGHLIEKNTEHYTGTGSLFGFSSTTEAFGPKPPVSGLFRISGAATQSITPTTEIGSGTVIVRQASQILDAENKGRLVAAFESTGITEIARPQAIKLSGRVGIYFQFREEGSGTLKVRGRAIIRLKPIHIGGGSYFIRGSAAESVTPATEIGSGSVFTFISSSESKGSNPPENTVLFKFRGSSTQKNTESYVGFGIERINVESLILIRPVYPGSGSISITSVSNDSISYRFTGSGNLFGFGSASEYLSSSYEFEKLVIRIRGSAQETSSESYIGSGSIFTFSSTTTSKGANPPENTVLFKFLGSSFARTQPVYAGEGQIKVSEGVGRPDKNNKTFIVSAEESASVKTTEKPVLSKVFGNAGVSKPSVYKGKGRLFGFGGASETTTFSPDDTKVLFKISGTAKEENTESYRGSGIIFSNIRSSSSETYVAKGQTNLFRITGSGTESFSNGNYNGSGQIVTSVQSRTIVSFRPKVISKLFEFTGNAQERNTEAFNGSGTIGLLISSGRSVFYDYTVSQKALRIFGTTFESFGKSNYNGKVNAIFAGVSQNRENKYVPPKKSRVIII